PISVRLIAVKWRWKIHTLFTRELWGRNWTYAHNGQLNGYKSLETGNFRPVGKPTAKKRLLAIA
ncbi:hypothetical protein SEEE0316_00447, partial [Salmonella enterica subsp. enterica serovar Enteritidis str. 648903 1-6]